MSNETLDPQGVKDKFGVPPERIVDYLALMGDAVDNVPGVDKVGPKTAAKLIQEYGSLEAVMAHADEVKGVVGENLRKALDWLPTGAHARHREDGRARCPSRSSRSSQGEPDRTKLAALYERFGFRSAARGAADKGDGRRAVPAGAAAGAAPTARRGAARSPRPAPAAMPASPGRGRHAFVATRKYETVLDEAALERWLAKHRGAPSSPASTPRPRASTR